MASAVAVLFLACQGTAVVYARSIGAPGSSAGAAQGSCHDAGQPDGKTADKNDCQANCQSQHTSSSPYFDHIVAATDLPAITTRIDRVIAVADSVPLAEPPLLQVKPPPLAILHCCLRN